MAILYIKNLILGLICWIHLKMSVFNCSVMLGRYFC